VYTVRDITPTKTGTVFERRRLFRIDETNRPEGLHFYDNLTIYIDLCQVSFGRCAVYPTIRASTMAVSLFRFRNV
jgi:hypothetical protein